MFKKSIFLWVFVILFTGVSMFLIKHEVQVLAAKLNQFHRDILDHQEAILVLKAEWSYLTQPSRIESLVRKHVAFRPTETKQIFNINTFPRASKIKVIGGEVK
jgi:hypothetical protein